MRVDMVPPIYHHHTDEFSPQLPCVYIIRTLCGYLRFSSAGYATLTYLIHNSEVRIELRNKIIGKWKACERLCVTLENLNFRELALFLHSFNIVSHEPTMSGRWNGEFSLISESLACVFYTFGRRAC